MATATLQTLMIGPLDAGRRLTLDEFASADFEGTHALYELARGVVVVTEVPRPAHGRVVRRVARAFDRFDEAHPGIIKYAAGGNECRIRLPGMQSDRHPDQAIYLTREPAGKRPWHRWIPSIVVEVVSRGGEDRDYVEKREEYLRCGIGEYWIFDPLKRTMLVLQRAGDVWDQRELSEKQSYQTELLPGLRVSVGEILGPLAEEDLDDADDLADDEIPPTG